MLTIGLTGLTWFMQIVNANNLKQCFNSNDSSTAFRNALDKIWPISPHLPPNVRHSLYDILLKMALLLLRRSFLCLWCCGGKLLMLSLSAMLRGLFHQCLYWFLSRNNSICALTTATYTYSSVLTKEARGTLKSPALFLLISSLLFQLLVSLHMK